MNFIVFCFLFIAHLSGIHSQPTRVRLNRLANFTFELKNNGPTGGGNCDRRTFDLGVAGDMADF